LLIFQEPNQVELKAIHAESEVLIERMLTLALKYLSHDNMEVSAEACTFLLGYLNQVLFLLNLKSRNVLMIRLGDLKLDSVRPNKVSAFQFFRLSKCN
jgi:hypothetical protein